MRNYLILAVAAVLVALILRDAVINRNRTDKTIAVTGLGTKDFTSDLIVWSGSFSKKNFNLKEAYAELDKDREILKNYLVSKGIPAASIVFSAVNINRDISSEYDSHTGRSRSVFNGFNLTQNVQVESQEVDKIEDISRKVSEIINQGVEFYSNTPEYYYTKLAELKVEMIADATKDANNRAEQIAKNANARLGKLKKASMGVFQIIAQNSSEDFSWGGSYNTYAKHKTATITTRLEYEVK
ncbi:MAG: SIMPL domain-containing protein [Leadbetterella sp.]|nr:SIMPL domain-containing protein [Leadbetterella sp.]